MFQKHSILRTKTNSINYLIVDVSHKKEKIAYYDLNKEPQQRKRSTDSPKKSTVRPARRQDKPDEMFLDEFITHISKYEYQVERAQYQNGLYIPKQFPKLKKDALIMEREQAADDNFELIRPIIEDEEKLYDYLYGKGEGNKHIQEISRNTGVKGAQIARLLAQYFFRGRSRNSLFPNYRYCGCNYQSAFEMKVDSPKRGRKAKYTEYRNRLHQDEQSIKQFLRKLGQRLFKRFNYTQQYRLYDFYYQSREVITENEEGEKSARRVPLLESQCISFSQYYSYVKQLEKDGSFVWRKDGERHFLKEYESRFGRARDGVYGPSFRYEIDATKEDVYLIFPYFHDQRLSSGRPVTYRVSCVYSGMVVGFHVGIGGPNWQGVMQALYNAFTDKVDFCKRYDINIEAWQWPCDVSCTELTIDNGVEYPKRNMAQLLDDDMGIDCINYTAIYSGESKGGVEGGFQVDKRDIIQFMPGYVERLPEKGDPHASNFATYTYYDFMRLLIAQTLIRNNEVFKNNIHDQVMSEEGIKSTSLAVWNFGMKYYMNEGRGKRFPKEQMLFALLPSGKAATTSRGIKFKGLHYSCQFAASKNWLTDSKSRSIKSLEVRFLDSDTNQIWYRYEGNIYTATLNDHSEIYRNRNWFDALHRLELYTKEKAIQKRKEREARIEQLNDTSAQTALAKERLNGAKAPTSKSPQKHVSTMAYFEKAMQSNATSNQFREILSVDGEGKVSMASGTIDMPIIGKTKQKNLAALYGGNLS
jgi:putative transposase